MTLPATARQATDLIDADHPDVVAFARSVTVDATTTGEAAGALFAAVRDQIRYDPYTLDLRRDVMRASTVLRREGNWCVPKATLLVAACRALDIPAQVGYADVRNHLSSAKLEALMGTDLFRWHGYAAIEVNGEVHKASPVFNAELCARFGVEPLDFDGSADALLHAFDGEGRQYMEYTHDRGCSKRSPSTCCATTSAPCTPSWWTARARTVRTRPPCSRPTASTPKSCSTAVRSAAPSPITQPLVSTRRPDAVSNRTM